MTHIPDEYMTFIGGNISDKKERRERVLKIKLTMKLNSDTY